MVTRGVVPIAPGAGGAELVAYRLAGALVEAGEHVEMVSDADEAARAALPQIQFHPLESRALRLVRRLPGGFGRWLLEHLVGNVTAAREARRLLGDTNFDLVHVHGALAAILIGRKAHAPLVYTEHDATPWMCRYRRWWERAIRKVVHRVVNVTAFGRADHVATVFDSLRAEIVERYRIPKERVTTIVNGTDVDLFNPHRPGVSLVRETFGFERYVLFVGRLTPRKAPDVLLRAVAEVPEVKCAFVGDGPMRRRLERLARELGVEDRVVFVGAVTPAELGRVYADADFTVLPSVSEGMPLAVIESMACGTPVLTSNVAGATSLIDDWETGFLLKPGDLGQLSMAIRFLWGDGDLRRRMGERAREKAIREFVWPGVAEQYRDLYANVVRRRVEVPIASSVPSLLA